MLDDVPQVCGGRGRLHPERLEQSLAREPGKRHPARARRNQSVIKVPADAVANDDARTRKLWFDVASNAHPTNSAEVSELLVELIRQIGVKRILYGTDSALGNDLRPREAWGAFRQLKLSTKEIKAIAGNVAPYFR